jgi:hypothetical protein
MKKLLITILGGAMFATACGTTASDRDATQDSAGGAAAPAATEARPAAATAATGPTYREITIPSGTALTLTLTSTVASDTSKVYDTVSGELTNAVTINGRDVLPAGTVVSGEVIEADGAGRVKGRAQVAFRFNTLMTQGNKYEMQTASLSRMAPATKGEDATKIAVGAGAGAVVGGILGGKDGAAKGAAVGGGAGTGVVLATKGQEVRLGPGADVSTQLTAPLTVRVRTS